MRRLMFTLVAAAVSAAAFAASPPPNFGTVVENGIYRGGQPSRENLEYLRSLGVKTILKLNGWRLEAERADADATGLTLVAIRFEPSTIGTASTCPDVARALAILTDRANWPVYVHCTRGRDRTGYLIGAYRELVQGWTWERVDRELAAFGHTEVLRRAFPAIAGELRTGAPACAGRLDRRDATPSAP